VTTLSGLLVDRVGDWSSRGVCTFRGPGQKRQSLRACGDGPSETIASNDRKDLRESLFVPLLTRMGLIARTGRQSHRARLRGPKARQ
jgi:hypothetical protein